MERALNDLKDRPPVEITAAFEAAELLPSTAAPAEVTAESPAAQVGPGGFRRIGPYEVIEVIGRGGMGVVYKALDPGLNRVVAVKVLAPELASNPQARHRFLREARAAAAVCHEHVVTIHAVAEPDDSPYLVMQYVAGQSLQEKIDRGGPLGLKEVLRVGMQVAAGLAAAHAQGLVHRDIKPANILLENGVERAKITDFGLARATNDARLTKSGTIAGTPQYMAPEQARSDPGDHRTDLFSLGSLLYAMTTGEPPFHADSALAVLRRVSDEEPTPVRSLNPEAPKWLVAVIERLMAKDPAARYQSAAEVAEVLAARLAELQSPSTSSPAWPKKVTAPRSRWRLVGVLAAQLAVAALAALFLRMNLTSEPVKSSAPAPATPMPPPVNWLALGLASNQNHEYGKAAEFLSEALRQDPRSFRALMARGIAYRYLQAYPRALADFSEAIRVNPRPANSYYERAFVLTQTGELDRAIADCDRALSIDPNLVWTYLHRGLAHLGKKDWDAAIADFDTFIRNVPDFAEVFTFVAQCHVGRGDLALAVADLDKGLRIKPDHVGIRHYRAWLRTWLGDYAGSIADYDIAIRADPNDHVKRSDRGCALALAGRYKEAEADFEAAIRLSEKYPWPLLRRAHNLYARRGEYDWAVADCDRMIAIDPNIAEAYFYRGLAFRAKGENTRTVKDLDRALALNQPRRMTFQGRMELRYPELFEARADARAKLGDPRGAESDRREAARLRSRAGPRPGPPK